MKDLARDLLDMWNDEDRVSAWIFRFIAVTFVALVAFLVVSPFLPWDSNESGTHCSTSIVPVGKTFVPITSCTD